VDYENRRPWQSARIWADSGAFVSGKWRLTSAAPTTSGPVSDPHPNPTVDDLAELCRYAAIDEIHQLMAEINPQDLSAMELVAMLTVLRPARERKLRQPAPLLKTGMSYAVAREQAEAEFGSEENGPPPSSSTSSINSSGSGRSLIHLLLSVSVAAKNALRRVALLRFE
jgi:hypothetical protein